MEKMEYIFNNCKFIIPAKESFIIEEVYENLESYKGIPKTVVDIGAHIGSLSIFLCKKGAKKVFAFEPDTKNYHLLCQNIVLNNMQDRIMPFHLGVGRECGVVKLRKARNSGQRSILYKSRFFRSEKIVVTDLQTIIRWIGTIDYLKIDVEGAEYEILMLPEADEIYNKIKYINLEVHNPTNRDYFNRKIITLKDRGIRCEEAAPMLLKYLKKHGFGEKPIKKDDDYLFLSHNKSLKVKK